MHVAFLGLGTMGAPMAANLARAGHALAVWNRTVDKARDFAALHNSARLAATPRDAAKGAEVVVLMLADPAAVRAVTDGKDGVLAGLGEGAVLVDMSTVDPGTARDLAARCIAQKAAFVDAPVSGTRKPAVDGTLLVMAGGADGDLARARPVLEAMGRVKHVGPVGSGMALKLVLNGLGAHMMVGFAQMLVFARKLQLDPRVAVEAIQGGAFSSPLYGSKAPRMMAHDFAADFTLALMLKDQELVLATARRLGMELPSLACIADVIRDALAAGFGADDLCGIAQLFEQRAGVRL